MKRCRRVVTYLRRLVTALAMSAVLSFAQAQEAVSSDLPNTPEGWEHFLLGPETKQISDMVLTGLSYIGIPYRYGGNNPEQGFDCSGLVRWVFRHTLGIVLPRRSADMAKEGQEVSREELEPGDLVFFNTLRRPYSHVGIYVGSGNFLHAPSSGGRVQVENIDELYWKKAWNGARRLEQLRAFMFEERGEH